MESEDQRAGLANVHGGTAWSAGLRPPLLSKAELNRRQAAAPWSGQRCRAVTSSTGYGGRS